MMWPCRSVSIRPSIFAKAESAVGSSGHRPNRAASWPNSLGRATLWFATLMASRLTPQTSLEPFAKSAIGEELLGHVGGHQCARLDASLGTTQYRRTL